MLCVNNVPTVVKAGFVFYIIVCHESLKREASFFKFYFQTKANENQQLTAIETTIDSNVFFLQGRYLKRKA